MKRDVGREIDRSLKRLADSSERESLDQVYRRIVLHLCVPCCNLRIEDPTGP